MARLDWARTAPGAFKAMTTLEAYVRRSGLEPELVHLIRVRASQINGCALCLALHTRDARQQGETEERLYLLNAWEESDLYSQRERAALAWTDAVTLVSETHVPDEVFNEARQEFTDEEMVNLTMAVVAINAWNRLGVGFRLVRPPGINALQLLDG
jgi:AhpD family alkylhydroperoxidase